MGQIGILKRNTLLQISAIEAELDNLAVLYDSLALARDSNLADLAVGGKIAEIKMLIEELPNLHVLENIEKTCDSARFFEVITEQTRNAAIRAQKKLARISKKPRK
jgi:hypothetical protein